MRYLPDERCPWCYGDEVWGADLVRQCYDCGEVWEEDDERKFVRERDPEEEGKLGFHIIETGEGDDDDE